MDVATQIGTMLAGLGAASVSSVQIQWPSGVTQRISKMPVDRYQHIEEPLFFVLHEKLRLTRAHYGLK